MSDRRVYPALISAKNAEAATGQSWRWIRDFARENAVPIYRPGAKAFVETEALLRAIRAHGLPQAGEPDDADELAYMRARVAKAVGVEPRRRGND